MPSGVPQMLRQNAACRFHFIEAEAPAAFAKSNKMIEPSGH
jgi:hypothetical protein